MGPSVPGGKRAKAVNIAEEISEASAHKMEIPNQACSQEGAILGDAGQFEVFSVGGGGDVDDVSCSQIRPLCGYPVRTQWQNLKLKNRLRRELRRTSDICSSLRRYKCILGPDDHRNQLIEAKMK